MQRHRDVELVDAQVLHLGHVFRLRRERVRLPSGLEQELDVIEHPGAVAVAALDPGGRLLLVRQYRHALGEWTHEIPAGRLDPGESPRDAARRELEEETGYRAGQWRLLREIVPAPGFCSEVIHLFLARELVAVAGGGRPCDPDEELELSWASPQELLGGPARDAKTLLAAALIGLIRDPG